jgi:hypothetical protein
VTTDHLLCVCGHRKYQHYQYAFKCDGDNDTCSCTEFHIFVSPVARVMADLPSEGDMCVTQAVPEDTAESKEWELGKAPIVGILSHSFVGNDDKCKGVLGFSPTSPRHGEICNNPRSSDIHLPEAAAPYNVEGVGESRLKDSGERLLFASGMVRDVDISKPAFDLLIPEGIPYSELMLTRWAELLRKGAKKYSRRNWELADSDEELERAKASAFRHFMQWFAGETDEDHGSAVFFNINEVETIKYKQRAKRMENNGS